MTNTKTKSKTGKTKAKEQPKKASLILTYGGVSGYPSGFYEGKDGPVIVQSGQSIYDNPSGSSNEYFEKIFSRIYHTLSVYGKANKSEMGMAYLYIGLSMHDKEAINAIKKYTDTGKDLSLVACECHKYEKEKIAKKLNVPIIWSECGGREALKNILENLLGRDESIAKIKERLKIYCTSLKDSL